MKMTLEQELFLCSLNKMNAYELFDYNLLIEQEVESALQTGNFTDWEILANRLLMVEAVIKIRMTKN
jgi:hypothetical protein